MQSVANRQRWSERVFLAFAVVCSLILAVAPAGAQGHIRGIVAGPFIVTPSLEADVAYDSNVLNVTVDAEEDTGDASASVGFGLGIRMPFGNNLLEFDYNGANVEYDNSEFAGGLRQTGVLGLRLQFRSGDALRISDRFLRDFSQIQDSSIPDTGPGFDPEQKYFGSPYNYNRFNIELERDDSRRIGYRARIGRRDFQYEKETVGSQFEFQGFDNAFEYFQPLSSSRKLVVHYGMRRLNNLRDGEGVFRKEVSDSLEAGLSGVGGVRPFFFRVGYSRFTYKYPEGSSGNDSDNFRGLSGFARWILPFGGQSSMALSLSRRPLPSSFDTFYVTNQFRLIAEHGFRPQVKVALLAGVRQNQYADEIPQLTCDGLRQDWTWDAGFRASWGLHPLIQFSLAGAHEERTSNCERVDYVSNSANLGIRLGWF
jgi:hypothetical protein